MLTQRAPRTLLLLLTLLTLHVSAATVIEQSSNDKHAYRSLMLDNQLQVLLISDPDTDKAAVSMSVNTGSADDPPHRPGLAHFLEHMLFLGTEKYPQAGEYQAFIQSHGGAHNAFTALTQTNYFFDIQTADLAPALDRFAQFFIAPLFSQEYTDRERHAVHSEYRAKIRDDYRRSHAALQQLLNPDHPASRFAVGSLQTLNDKPAGTLRRDLLTFYRAHYSANNMKLAILGKQSLEQLEQLAKTYFSAIQNRQLTPLTIAPPQYPAERLPVQLDIRTLTEQRRLQLTFVTPSQRPYLLSKPLSLIAGVIGYEGAGSLLAQLKNKGWATGLSAGAGADYQHESSLNIAIALTEQGMQHSDQVVALFFSFIQDLRQQGISQALFSEEQKLSRQAFRFLPKQAPIHYVTELTSNMQEYPRRYWISANFALEHYQPEVIRQFIDTLTPDNMVLSRQGPDLATDQIETHYQTPYRISTPTAQQRQQWRAAKRQPELYVRQLNPFVAERFTVKKPDQPALNPQLHLSTPGNRQWFLADAQFATPRADYFFTLLTPLARQGAEQHVGLQLYARLVREQLNSTLYDAAMAGLDADIYAHARGISVRISGYDDKLTTLVPLIAAALRQPDFNPQRFQQVRAHYLEELNRSTHAKPYQQLYRVAYEQLLDTPTLAQRQQAAKDYSLDQLKTVANDLFAPVEIRQLAHGNLTRQQADQLNRQLTTHLAPLKLADVAPILTTHVLPAGQRRQHTVDVAHNDHAVLLYLQSPDNSMRAQALTLLLSEILSAPFYSQLRTEQQLGYIVSADPLPMRKHPGLGLVVQSPSHDNATIEQRMDTFLTQFTTHLKALDNTQLQRYVDSVINRVNEKEVSLRQRSQRLWQEIDLDYWQFDYRQRLVAELNSLDLTKLVNFYQQLQHHSQRFVVAHSATLE